MRPIGGAFYACFCKPVSQLNGFFKFSIFRICMRNTARRENYIRTVRQYINNATNSHAPSRVTRANAGPDFVEERKKAAQLANAGGAAYVSIRTHPPTPPGRFFFFLPGGEIFATRLSASDPNLLGEGCPRVPAERGKQLAASHT